MQETLLKLISLGSIVLICISLVLVFLNLFGISNPIRTFMVRYRLNLLFLISLIGTLGSILLSIYFKLAPCELCWYQRLFLFSSPVIARIALLKNDTTAHIYIFWLSFIGLLISIYHSLLQSKIFAPDTVFCNPTSVIDCSVPQFVYYGFVTVPVISFSVFLLLLLISYDYKKI